MDAVASTTTVPWSADRWASRQKLRAWPMAPVKSKPLSRSSGSPPHSERRRNAWRRRKPLLWTHFAETPDRQEKKYSCPTGSYRARRRPARPDWLIWFVWFIWFIWFVSFNQTNEIDQTNQMNRSRPDAQKVRSARPQRAKRRGVLLSVR